MVVVFWVVRMTLGTPSLLHPIVLRGISKLLCVVRVAVVVEVGVGEVSGCVGRLRGASHMPVVVEEVAFADVVVVVVTVAVVAEVSVGFGMEVLLSLRVFIGM